jgi:eukaryotic-like serine/threonine-protein kinase
LYSRISGLFSSANLIPLLVAAAFLVVDRWPDPLLQPLVWIEKQISDRVYDLSARSPAPLPVILVQVPPGELQAFTQFPAQSHLIAPLTFMAARGTVAVFLPGLLRSPVALPEAEARELQASLSDAAQHRAAASDLAGALADWQALQAQVHWLLPWGQIPRGPNSQLVVIDPVEPALSLGEWLPNTRAANAVLVNEPYQFFGAGAYAANALAWRQDGRLLAGLPLVLLEAARASAPNAVGAWGVGPVEARVRALATAGKLPMNAGYRPQQLPIAEVQAQAVTNALWLVVADVDSKPLAVAAAVHTLAAGAYPLPPPGYPLFTSGLITLLALSLLGWWLRVSPWGITVYSVVMTALLVVGQGAAQVYASWWLPVSTAVALVLVMCLLRWLIWMMAYPYIPLLTSWRVAWLQILQQQIRAGQLAEAERQLEDLHRCRPEAWQLQLCYELAQNYEKQRRYDRAEQLYQTLLARAANYADVRGRLSRLQELSSGHASGGLDATLVIDEQIINKPVLGRYEIQKELGRGAMGVVYLGRDPRISRMVAIKTLHYQHFEAEQLPEVKARFFREAEAAGRLSHPNIVSVFDVGEEADLAFMAMDYMPGRPLSFYCAPERLLPVPIVYGLVAKAADALFYAHKHHIVHRDIKPSNLLYDGETGRMKVSDFGIARLVDNSKTRTGDVMGSPLYMSPEQLKGAKVGERADIYSLGVTMYQLLTGKLPYDGDSLANLTYNILQGKHPSVRTHRPDLPASATRITNKALQKEPADRFQNAKEMAEALRKSLARDF